MYTVHCTGYILLHPVHPVQFSLDLCTLYTVHCTGYILLHPVHPVQFFFDLCTLYTVQAISFYTPYTLYKFSHDGRISKLLQNLQNVIPFNEHREDKLGDIHIYLQGRLTFHFCYSSVYQYVSLGCYEFHLFPSVTYCVLSHLNPGVTI